ncbi:PAS domain S-box protein [Solirubrobacter phytolaccae]|uniref:PAS domain S-box protein n=1 Tax=Solirubrobacter phytolaccae TaxID=1404360 RepID=A0A9X3N6F1_9ACTN|nr:PAS domain S-box protein [Solirubrobacter phytolaccae]MDA0180578.1 PAS domain S-box protein [Solirubrobacter phytolaccae]
MPGIGSTDPDDPAAELGSADPARGYLAGLIDILDAAVVATDREFTVTGWNPGAERMYGCSAAEVLGHPVRALAVLPGDLSLARLERELTERGRSRIELVARRRDGVHFDVEVTAGAIRAQSNGELIGYLAIHRDVTQRGREEARLRASEHRTEAVVEGVTEAFCVFDEHRRCAYLNARAVLLLNDLTGRSLARADLVGQAVADVFPGFAGSEVEAHVVTAGHNQQTVVFELPLGHRWFHVHVSPSPRETTVAIHEITERKLVEADRHRRTQQQSALADLARRAAIDDDIQDLRTDAVDAIVGILGADRALVVEHERADDRYRVRAAAGRAPEAIGQVLGPTAAGPLLARAMAQGDTVLYEDAAETGLVAAPREGTGWVVVGVPGLDTPFGALAVLACQRRFGPDEADFLRAAASVLATAAARAQGERALDEVRAAVPALDRPGVDKRLRLLLVEAHAALREAMGAALEAEPDVGDVRQAGSLAEARTMTDDVDVALVDLLLPDGDGAELIADLRRRSPDAQALIISARADRAAAASAVEHGAAGVLTEQTHLLDVIAAIRRVRCGEPLMPLAEVVDLLRLAGRRRERELDDRRALDSLTAREREVLHLLAEGLGNRAAAAQLHVSPRTHRNHVANILAKLGVHSQLQALLFALRYGVIEIGQPGEPA